MAGALDPIKLNAQTVRYTPQRLPGLDTLSGILKDMQVTEREDALRKQLLAEKAAERAYQRDRDAKQDAITNEKLGWLRDEQKTKESQRKALDDLFTRLPSAEVKETVQVPAKPGVAGNKAEVEAAEKKAAEVLKQQEEWSKNYLKAYEKAQNTPGVGVNGHKSPTAWDRTKALFAGSGFAVKSQREQLDDIQAAKEADRLAEANTGDSIIGRLGMPEAIPSVPELVESAPGTPAYTKEVTKMLSRDEWTNKVSKDILADKSTSGEVKRKLLKEVGDYADALYGDKAKAPTIANQLSLVRLQQSLAKDKQTKADKDAAAASKKAKEVIATDKTLGALNSMFKQYGAPDVIGTGQQAGIQADTMKIKQKYGLTDSQMSSLVNQAMGQYATGSMFGVDEEGFTTKLEELAGVLTGKK
jgi:hypothetical protein